MNKKDIRKKVKNFEVIERNLVDLKYGDMDELNVLIAGSLDKTELDDFAKAYTRVVKKEIENAINHGVSINLFGFMIIAQNVYTHLNQFGMVKEFEMSPAIQSFCKEFIFAKFKAYSRSEFDYSGYDVAKRFANIFETDVVDFCNLCIDEAIDNLV